MKGVDEDEGDDEDVDGDDDHIDDQSVGDDDDFGFPSRTSSTISPPEGISDPPQRDGGKISDYIYKIIRPEYKL